MLWTFFVCLYFSPYLSSGLHSFWVSHKRQAAENQPRTLFPENQRQPLFRHFANYHRDSVHKLQLFLSLNQLFTYQKDFSSSEIKRGGKDKEEKLNFRNWVELLKKMLTLELKCGLKNSYVSNDSWIGDCHNLSLIVLFPIIRILFNSNLCRLMGVKPLVLQMYCVSLSNASKSGRGKDPETWQNRLNRRIPSN